jgi:hypothetical protein
MSLNFTDINSLRTWGWRRPPIHGDIGDGFLLGLPHYKIFQVGTLDLSTRTPSFRQVWLNVLAISRQAFGVDQTLDVWGDSHVALKVLFWALGIFRLQFRQFVGNT